MGPVPNNFSFGANAGLASAAGAGVTIMDRVDPVDGVDSG